MSLLIVAVEASADLHGAAVLRELRALVPDLKAFGAGGPRMRAEGFEALVRAEDLSVMGIAEVLPALPRIFEAMDALREAARERKPSLALLIDSPDFNLRLARRLRELRIKVAYFIGPSVWAWRTYRVKQIARDVARMLVILPFEAAFYAKHGVEARYVGNPLADELRALPAATADRAAAQTVVFGAATGPVLALLPGSRLQEIHRLWPPMLAAARKLQASTPGLRLVVPIAGTLDRALFGYAPDVQFVSSAAIALAAADAAIVASGTATLEAALALVPQVVVYRTSWLSWLVGRLLIRVRFISLPNLLAGKALVPELLQSRCTPQNIAGSVAPLLAGGPDREAQLEGLRAVRAELLPPGAPGASRRAAEEVAALMGSPA
ncbi:MAG TPA: lipid-A-disaccharide synthase [Myxococcales bacterium]|nr:lipid-A-disaccharide synthase [Myxococcales bacterium]